MNTEPKEPERLEGEHVSEAVLLPLLQEYTERLREECERYLSSRLGLGRMKYLASILAGLMIIWLGIFAQVHIVDLKSPLMSVGAVGGVCAIIVGFMMSFVGVRGLSLDSQRQVLARHEVRATAARLEKIVRLASQLEEHATKDMGVKIKLDLRLADAETALTFVKSVFEVGRSRVSRDAIAGLELAPTTSREKRSGASSIKSEEHLPERRPLRAPNS